MARRIWQSRYRADAAEGSVPATWRRIATGAQRPHRIGTALARHPARFPVPSSVATSAPQSEPRHFPLTDYAVQHWLSGGPMAHGVCWSPRRSCRSGRAWQCQASASTDRDVTLFNCVVMAKMRTVLGRQAPLQGFADNSISKTIKMPPATSFADLAPCNSLPTTRGRRAASPSAPTGPAGAVLTSDCQCEEPSDEVIGIETRHGRPLPPTGAEPAMTARQVL